MDKKLLLAIVDIYVKDAINALKSDESFRSLLQGPRGLRGRDGKDADVDHLKSDLLKYIDENFSNEIALTEEQFNSLKGIDGKDFVFSEHKEEISNVIQAYILEIKDSLKLTFSDLTEEERLSLKGSRGQRGKEGKSFSWEENQDAINSLLVSHIESIKSELKLSFSDLSEDEKNGLKLTFKDLSDEEKNSLKLTFNDLTEEEKLSLKGSRGQRGKQGFEGPKGEDGQRGSKLHLQKSDDALENDFYIDPNSSDLFHFINGEWIFLTKLRGARGAIGPSGLNGKDGLSIVGPQGPMGESAPIIEDVEVNQNKGEFTFIFTFSNGRVIETNEIKIPHSTSTIVVSGGGGSTPGPQGPQGPQGDDGLSAYQVAVENGFVGTEEEWLDSLVGPPGPGGSLEILDEYDTVTTAATSLNFVGPNVRIRPRTYMSEWALLSDVEPSIADYDGGGNPSKVDVLIEFLDPSKLIEVACDPTVYVGAFVRLNNLGVAFNAIADNYNTSNVIGICEFKHNATLCDIRVSGKSADIFVGLDTSADYFLSNTVAGLLTTNVPTTSGHIKLSLGQAFSATSFVYSKSERVVRA